MIRLEERAREIDGVGEASESHPRERTTKTGPAKPSHVSPAGRLSCLDDHTVINYESALGEPTAQTMSSLICSSEAAHGG